MPKLAGHLLALAGVLLGVSLGRRDDIAPPVPAPVAAVAPARPPAPSPEELSGEHLARTLADSEAMIDRHLAPLGSFFRDAHGKTPAFAEWALGWGSKRRLVQDRLPFGRRDRHAGFLREKFEQTVFAPADLEREARQAVAAYGQELRALENRMLLAVRADVALHPADYALGTATPEELAARFDAAMLRVAGDAAGPAGAELVLCDGSSIAAGEALTVVLMRRLAAGMAGRFAAKGAGYAVAGSLTLGVGLVVGVAVDQIVTYVWDRVADPKGKLALEVNARIDELQRATLDELRGQLRAFARSRAELRGRAVVEVVRASAVTGTGGR